MHISYGLLEARVRFLRLSLHALGSYIVQFSSFGDVDSGSLNLGGYLTNLRGSLSYYFARGGKYIRNKHSKCGGGHRELGERL